MKIMLELYSILFVLWCIRKRRIKLIIMNQQINYSKESKTIIINGLLGKRVRLISLMDLV